MTSRFCTFGKKDTREKQAKNKQTNNNNIKNGMFKIPDTDMKTQPTNKKHGLKHDKSAQDARTRGRVWYYPDTVSAANALSPKSIGKNGV